jgi:hypothetical protein
MNLLGHKQHYGSSAITGQIRPVIAVGALGNCPPHRSVADQVLIGVVLEVAASQEEPELIAP